jgi:hypothetical protein
VGDADGDGVDEIYAFDNRSAVELLKLRAGRLERLWRRRLEVPDRMRNWENPWARFSAFSAETGDLDGDGRAGLVMGDSVPNTQVVMALSPKGETMWISEPVRRHVSYDTRYELYSSAFVRVARLNGRPRIVCVTGGLVRLLDTAGNVLKEAEAPVGFTDLVVDGHTLYLGSTPNGDNTIYRIDLAGGWQRAVRGLRRQGLAAEIGRNLAGLRRRVLSRKAVKSPVRKRYDIELASFWTRITGLNIGKTEACRWFRGHLRYENLRFVATQKVIEPTQPLDAAGKPWSDHRWDVDSINGTQTVEEIVEAARRCERERVPTVFGIGHSCMPFIRLATAEKMLLAAPRYLVGFESAEDEDPCHIARYLRGYIGPLADLCAKHGGRKVFLRNKNVWWMSVPAIRECFDALFTGARRRVIVAATEDSNSRTPELNLFARLGLRQAGLTGDFKVSAVEDLFSFCRFHEWEYPRSGHPYLRLLVAHTVLGGGVYHFRHWHAFERAGKLAPTLLGEESVEIFLRMLGKGLVFTPRPEQMAGLSRLGFAVHEPPAKWTDDGHNGHCPHRWVDDPELHNAALPHNGCLWGNSPTPAHALQRVLLRKSRQFGCHVPATPYGPFVMVPAHADLSKVTGVDDWWHTDGVSIWREGEPKLTGGEAADALLESFEEAAGRLPFRSFGEDVFFHTVRIGRDAYRLFAIDPGWLDPADRRISIRTQLPGRCEFADCLTGRRVAPDNVVVPAGSLRIIEAIG